ncbi:MAG: CBS domain-containing protein, partial [Rhodothermales bacterium]|nr:CBS domain-containing protein [Rhodothermales bacterium]
MTIEKLISHSVPPLTPEDTVEFALSLLLELRVRHLPVVDHDGALVGIVSEERLLDAQGPEALVGEFVAERPVSADTEQHVFDAAKILVQHDLTTLPVLDQKGRFVGVVKRNDIMDQFARMLSTHESGAILALEVSPKDYSLSKLVYSIEQANVQVLSVATESPDRTEGVISITLKLNTTDTARVRHVLEHQGYRIIASFSEEEDDEEFRNRVQEFM